MVGESKLEELNFLVIGNSLFRDFHELRNRLKQHDVAVIAVDHVS